MKQSNKAIWKGNKMTKQNKSVVEQVKSEVAKEAASKEEQSKKTGAMKSIESVIVISVCGVILLGLATVGAKQFINLANADYQLYAAIFFVVALAYITFKAFSGLHKSN